MNFSRNTAVTLFKRLTLHTLLPDHRRILLPLTLCLLLIQTQTRDVVINVLSDAFWQVAVFVAMTLTVYHLFSDKISALYTNNKGEKKPFREIITASLMGVLPGCGGAIVVITQYVSGQMSFGAVAAVLTSTMGDAAFLLLAAQPITGLGMVILCFCVGLISGVVINVIHGPDFLRHTTKVQPRMMNNKKYATAIPKRIKYQGMIWQWLMIPGAIVGLLMASQVNVAALIGISEASIQLIGSLIAISFITLWAITREVTSFESIVSEDKKLKQNKIFQKVALDTNFVISWVVIAFLAFELMMLYSNVNLDALYTQLGTLAPLISVVVGMIPGCGPQIITTSLYLSGAIPLSAQIGNAISNDGDALFPAIALSPKVALIATLYSSIPALIAAYGYFWLFE